MGIFIFFLGGGAKCSNFVYFEGIKEEFHYFSSKKHFFR